MEQMIIEFFAKAAELILHNRLSTTQTLEGILNKLTDPSPTRFQLTFEQKFNFANNIPIQWSSQHHKLLVIEFFVCLKNGSNRTLAEQWIFDLSQISESRLENTIDSTNTLYKRLSVLLRSISTLSVTLPLYQICSKEGQLGKQYRIEHSISFTRHTVSKWHPKVYDTQDLSAFSCPDFVLPGRTLCFKVNYLKSLHSLPDLLEEAAEKQPLIIPSESEGSSPIIENDFSLQNKAKVIKRHCSENQSNRNMRLSNSNILGPQINSCQVPTLTNEGVVPSPNFTKLTADAYNSSPTLKNEISLKMNSSRIRIKTLESEQIGEGEGEIFICENDEEKFTEVLSLNEMNIRTNSSPAPEPWQKSVKKFSDHEKHRKMSEDFENSRRKLSLNIKPIEKVIEQSDDDKIAELLLGIEGLKVMNNSSSNKSRGEKEGRKAEQIGIRFELTSRDHKEVSNEISYQLNEFSTFRDLYLEMKGSSPFP